MSINIFQQVIASLYKRKNKTVLSAKDLELLVSMELRWFDPSEARKMIKIALELDLLEEIDGGLRSRFDLNAIGIPLGFKPPKDLLSTLEHSQESLFMQLVNHISINTGIEPNQIIAEINDRQSKLEEYLVLEVIAIMYGKEKDVDVDKFIPDIKTKLLSDKSK